jgi:DNA-binding LytR/AlgR family response regulator
VKRQIGARRLQPSALEPSDRAARRRLVTFADLRTRAGAASRQSGIHRSAIVNRARIREIVPEGSSRHTVVLAGGTRLILSRTRADRLRDWRL